MTLTIGPNTSDIQPYWTTTTIPSVNTTGPFHSLCKVDGLPTITVRNKSVTFSPGECVWIIDAAGNIKRARVREVHRLVDERYSETYISVTMNLQLGAECEHSITQDIEKIIFNPPATIVFWNDGTKTVVKTSPDEEFDEEKGLAMAISEKYLGNYSRFKKIVENAQRPEWR